MIALAPHIPTNLDAEEWRLVKAMRAVPPSPLRGRLVALVEEMVAEIQTPRCAEQQADGVPCDGVHRLCEDCQGASALLETLRAGRRGH